MTTKNYVTDLQSQAVEAVKTGQAATLEAVKTGQAAALETVQTWRDAVAKLVPEIPSVYDPRATIGDPAAILDSVYDFAKDLVDLNKAFAHQILDASQATAKKPAAKSVKAV
jgi:hypothetical protein